MRPTAPTLAQRKCTAPSLIPTVNGNTVRSFSTHGQQSAAQGSSTTVSRSDLRLIQYLDSSALGLVLRWRLIGYFPIHLSPSLSAHSHAVADTLASSCPCVASHAPMSDRAESSACSVAACTPPPMSAPSLSDRRTAMQKLRNRAFSGWRSLTGPLRDAPPISLYTIGARTHTYTCAAKVWDLSIVQGPFSVAPCQTLGR
jgi:hypothetical protein